jgi:hypothetical protein
MGAEVVLAAVIWAFRHIGVWLVLQHSLAPAHAIVLLSGSRPYRAAKEAAQLYPPNSAWQVSISKPASPRQELRKLDIRYVDDSFYSQKVLIASALRCDAIRVFQTSAAHTEEQVRKIASECRRDQAHRVIVVTSKARTGRGRSIRHRVAGHDPEALVRPVLDVSFGPAHGWRSTTDGPDVRREFSGLANASLGFPLRPEPH